jgi:hypothetical protein
MSAQVAPFLFLPLPLVGCEQEELLTQRLLLEELGEEKMRLLIQELVEQELARSSFVEEGVEWSERRMMRRRRRSTRRSLSTRRRRSSSRSRSSNRGVQRSVCVWGMLLV